MMDAIERDYHSVLLADHEPPCFSLYQKTHRAHPEKQQDPIRFRNLARELETSLKQRYAGWETTPILQPFNNLAEDGRFWAHALDGLAVFATSNLFKVYRLQRPVPEMAVVSDSFHTKPLMRVLQSADRYFILGLNRQEATLFEGNRYVLDEIELPPAVPRTVFDVVGPKQGEPERKNRVYGPAGPGTTRHGTNVRQEEIDSNTERFFRAIDAAVLEHYSRPSGMPLLLAALPEHHHLFRTVSRNPFLMAGAIDTFAGALPIDELRERAWGLMLPQYLDRLRGLVERFGEANANGRGCSDLSDVGRATAAGRVATLLIEADRVIPGRFDHVSGAIAFAPSRESGADDLLDELGENALKAGSDVVIVPRERMPTDTGIAAIYRF
jgi:release factor family 3